MGSIRNGFDQARQVVGILGRSHDVAVAWVGTLVVPIAVGAGVAWVSATRLLSPPVELGAEGQWIVVAISTGFAFVVSWLLVAVVLSGTVKRAVDPDQPQSLSASTAAAVSQFPTILLYSLVILVTSVTSRRGFGYLWRRRFGVDFRRLEPFLVPAIADGLSVREALDRSERVADSVDADQTLRPPAEELVRDATKVLAVGVLAFTFLYDSGSHPLVVSGADLSLVGFGVLLAGLLAVVGTAFSVPVRTVAYVLAESESGTESPLDDRLSYLGFGSTSVEHLFDPSGE